MHPVLDMTIDTESRVQTATQLTATYHDNFDRDSGTKAATRTLPCEDKAAWNIAQSGLLQIPESANPQMACLDESTSYFNHKVLRRRCLNNSTLSDLKNDVSLTVSQLKSRLTSESHLFLSCKSMMTLWCQHHARAQSRQQSQQTRLDTQQQQDQPNGDFIVISHSYTTVNPHDNHLIPHGSHQCHHILFSRRDIHPDRIV